jgi:hypothetical protein
MTTDTPTSERSSQAAAVLVNGQLIAILSDDASAALPSRGQVAVRGTLNGHEFQTVVEPDGRRGHWIRISEQLEQTAGVKPGDSVSIHLSPAKEWPEPEVPSDLMSALDQATDIADLWASITPMARWEWVRWVQATKNPSTRERRVEVSISKMRSGKRRPCCFDLSACTDPDLAKSGKLITAAG